MTAQTYQILLKTVAKHLWFWLARITLHVCPVVPVQGTEMQENLFPLVSDWSRGIMCYHSYTKITHKLKIVLLSPRSGEKQFSKVILQKVIVLLFFSVHKANLKHFFTFSLSTWSVSCLFCFGLVNKHTLFIITFHLRFVSKIRDSKAERTQTKNQYWGGEMTFKQVNYK